MAPVKHGMSGTPIYRQWQAMKSRCTLPRHIRYSRYGGRGITFCDEWRSFEGFYRDMGPSWRPGLLLDRADNDRGYEQSNCRWVTPSVSMRNTSRARLIDSPWGRIPLVDAEERSGIDRETLWSRIKAGTNPFRIKHEGSHGL
jgi:hypothetical protein